jgi:hypothetical protein
VAIATFWRTFHHDGKMAQSFGGAGGHALPLSVYLPSRTTLWCTLQLKGQIQYTLTISTIVYPYMYSVCGIHCEYGNVRHVFFNFMHSVDILYVSINNVVRGLIRKHIRLYL